MIAAADERGIAIVVAAASVVLQNALLPARASTMMPMVMTRELARSSSFGFSA